MEYVFLVYADGPDLERDSAPEGADFARICLSHDEALRQSGYILAGGSLQSDSPALTVRVRNGKAALTGGPTGRKKAPLVAAYFIRARDLNEAVRLASHMPQAQGWPIEVRPLADPEQRI